MVRGHPVSPALRGLLRRSRTLETVAISGPSCGEQLAGPERRARGPAGLLTQVAGRPLLTAWTSKLTPASNPVHRTHELAKCRGNFPAQIRKHDFVTELAQSGGTACRMRPACFRSSGSPRKRFVAGLVPPKIGHYRVSIGPNDSVSHQLESNGLANWRAFDGCDSHRKTRHNAQ